MTPLGGAAGVVGSGGPEGPGRRPEGAPIFVTVGTQLAFPRLIDAVDALAPALGRRVIAQVGPEEGDPGRWRNVEVAPFLDAPAFAAMAAGAAVIVGHAGIGTFLTARAHGVPAVLAPRSAALGEHRNEHQRATARRLEGRPGLAIAWEMADLEPLIRAALAGPAPTGGATPAGGATPMGAESSGGTLAALTARIAEEIARS